MRTATLTSVAFLKTLGEAVSYRIHTNPMNNGIQFDPAGKQRRYGFHRPFGRLCRAHGIEYRLTCPRHPWTNGQAERMFRTLEGPTVRTYHCETYRQLRRHVRGYLSAHNLAKHLIKV